MWESLYMGILNSLRQQTPGGSQLACSQVDSSLASVSQPSTLSPTSFGSHAVPLLCLPVHWDPGFSCVSDRPSSWLVVLTAGWGL